MRKYCFRNIVTCLFLFKASTTLCQVHAVPIADTISNGNLLFTENKNQWQDFIKFKCTLQNGAIFLEKNRFTYSLVNGSEMDELHGGSNQGNHNRSKEKVIVHGQAYSETFVNANPEVSCVGSSPADYYANYFIGNDSKRWASNVQLYHVVTYQNLYKGIDLTIYSKVSELTYDFAVSPGADAGVLQISYKGLDGLYLADGNLVLKTSIGNNVEEKPYAYQIINGNKVDVSCNYLLDGTNVSFSFPLGYNHNYPLIIDPQFVFGTYTGSTSDNWGFTATYDASGNMYVGGIVFGSGYPVTTGAFQVTFAGGVDQDVYLDDSLYPGYSGYEYGYDIGIAKFNSTGTNLLYATYLGGNENEQPQSMIVNNEGNLVILGRSNSTNFPVTSPTFQSTNNGGWDIIVSELNSTGTTLLASTYVGGSNDDGANMSADYWAHDTLEANYGDNARGEVIVDNSDNVYVASCTRSSNFPTTSGAYQQQLKGPQDGCVFKLNKFLNIMEWSTLLGGSSDDAAYSLKLDNNKNVYVCGGTYSSDFPSTAGALQPAYQGNIDGYITKLSSDGSRILHSTFIGTPDYDQTYLLDVDSNFNVYVFGQTLGNFPVTSGVYSNPNSGHFVEGLDSTLSTTLFSTVFGSGTREINISPTAFMIDTCQNIYMAGWGGMINFQGGTYNLPVTSNAFQSTTNGSDFYFIVLKKNATSLLYATYFGDPNDEQHVDGGTSRFDKYGYMYEAICGGCGGHSGLPTTPGCWSSTNNSGGGCNEAAIKFKFDLDGPVAAFTPTPYKGCVPLTVNFINNSNGGLAYEWNFGNGDTSSQANPSYTFTDTGTFKVTLIALNSTACKISDTTYAYIKVSNHVLHASFSKTEINYCDSIGVSFSNMSNGGTSFSWNFGDGSSSTLENPTHIYTVPGIDTVTFIVYDTSFCNPYDTIKDTINFTDVVTAQIQDTLFKGCSPYTINFNDMGFGGKTFQWNFGDGTSSTAQNPSHTYTVAGTYHVSLYVFDPTTCNKKDSAFATVIVFPAPPVVSFTASPTIVQYLDNTTVQFTNTTTGGTLYLWTFGDGDTSTSFNTSHLYTKDGVYKACLFASNSGPCPDSLCTIIDVQIVPIIDVPNAFSPNGDGINDVLYVKGQGMASIDFKIFNRWGELVFESRDMSVGWDGIYNGKAQEMDVYDWTLEGITLDGTQVFKKGNVTLLR